MNTWQIIAYAVDRGSHSALVPNGYKVSQTGTYPTADRNITRSACYVARSWWTSDCYASLDLRELMIWNRTLTLSELASEISKLRVKYGVLQMPYTIPSTIGSFLSLFSTTTNVSLSSQYQYLYGIILSGQPISLSDLMMCPTGTYAWYIPSSFGDSKWKDISGNGRDVTSITGTLTSSTSSLSGTSATAIEWPSDVLPSTYTLFHVTRYNGPTRNRIVQSRTNWLSGHNTGMSGVAFHGSALTQMSTSLHGDNWVISCDTANTYRSNGVYRNNTLITNGTSARLGINIYSAVDNSDFAISEVIVYDRQLTLVEIAKIETYLSARYNIPLANRTLMNITSSTIMCLFSMRHLNPRYAGPIVRLKCSGVEQDFYGDIYGRLTSKYGGQGTDVADFISGKASSTLTVVTWYDQSGRGIHITANDALYSTSGYLEMTGSSMATTSNIFPTTSTSDCHLIVSSAHVSNTTSYNISLSSTMINPTRHIAHLQWQGTFMYDGGNQNDQRCSLALTIPLGQRFTFSASKMSGTPNRFRVNGGTRASASANGVSAPVTTLYFDNIQRQRYYDLVITNSRLGDAEEASIESLFSSSALSV